MKSSMAHAIPERNIKIEKKKSSLNLKMEKSDGMVSKDQ